MISGTALSGIMRSGRGGIDGRGGSSRRLRQTIAVKLGVGGMMFRCSCEIVGASKRILDAAVEEGEGRQKLAKLVETI